MNRIILSLLFLLCCLGSGAQSGFSVVELNTENFFDCLHDEGKSDNAFLPVSERHWTERRYWCKMENLSKELIALSRYQPPDLIALTEVENDSVLRDLTRRAVLREGGYRYVMTHSSDARGIDVALLYQPGTFRLLSHDSICVEIPFDADFHTRDILHVTGVVYTGDTLDILVCHFSSKLGGELHSRKYRMSEAQQVATRVAALQRMRTNAKVIILGDFNDSPNSLPMTVGLGASGTSATHPPFDGHKLYNLAYGKQGRKGVKGTYKFRDKWEMLDQCIVSGNLLDPAASLSSASDSLRIGDFPFLLVKDETFGSVRPFRTYYGMHYEGGFSDHLPIVLRFRCFGNVIRDDKVRPLGWSRLDRVVP